MKTTNGMEHEVIYRYNRPYGIRNGDGYLLFFPRITAYSDQQERYQSEIKKQMELAERLCNFLNIKI